MTGAALPHGASHRRAIGGGHALVVVGNDETLVRKALTDFVAEAFFPERLSSELMARPACEAARGFAEAWTRLGAGLKCLGCGLALDDPRDGWARVEPLRHARLGAPEGFVLSLTAGPLG